MLLLVKKNKPTFSIIIPALNEEEHLPLLLKDLSKQIRKNFEIILVDGNSVDQTVARAKEYKPILPIKIFISKKRNVSYQRNLGAKHALSDHYLFMDADNRLEPDFTFQLEENYQKYHSPPVYSTLILPDSPSFRSHAIAHLANLYFTFQNRSKKPATLESMLGFEKSVFMKLGGFDTKKHWGEGGALLEKASQAGFPLIIFRNPKYHYSLRRFQGRHALKNLLNVVRLETSRLIGLSVDPNKVKEIYPMKGGHQSH